MSQTLKHQVSSARLSHAYLFVGTRGTGKTSCAKILAKAINCLDPQDGNPCNRCSSCVGIESGSILDVLELDAASNNGVDNVRALREEAVFTPVDVKKRVYIVDEVHMLSAPAFNALLKILEEPPEHLIFILATTELHKVPATILSRCQRYMFKRILPGDIAERLSEIAGREQIELAPDAASLLARRADGSLRDALSLLDQCAAENVVDLDRVVSAIGLAASGQIAGLLNATADRDVPEALRILDSLYIGGKVMSDVLEELLSRVRDKLVMLLMPKGGAGLLSGGFDEQTLSDFAARLSEERLLDMMELLRQSLADVSKGAGSKLAAELCLIRLAGSPARPCGPAAMPATAPLKKEQTARAPEREEPAAPAGDPPNETPAQGVADEQKPEAEAPPASDEDMSDALPDLPSPAETDRAENSPAATVVPPTNFWNAVLEYIKPRIGMPEYSFLSDAGSTSADLNGNILTVRPKSAFHAKVLDVLPVTEALKDAAKHLLGKPVAVRITPDKDVETGSSDKLDALRRYPNIKFE